MFNCKKTTRLVSKKIDQKLSFFEKISLKIHLFICPPCATFKTETEVISDCLKTTTSNTPTLSEEKKEAMKKILNSNSI